MSCKKYNAAQIMFLYEYNDKMCVCTFKMFTVKLFFPTRSAPGNYSDLGFYGQVQVTQALGSG